MTMIERMMALMNDRVADGDSSEVMMILAIVMVMVMVANTREHRLCKTPLPPYATSNAVGLDLPRFVLLSFLSVSLFYDTSLHL